MHAGSHGARFGVNGGISGSFLSGATSASSASTFTFSSKALGNPHASRRIVVGVAYRDVTAGTILQSTCTIGGVTATVHVDANSENRNIGIISANVPTGMTGDVVLNFGDTAQTCAISMYRLVGETNATPQTASDLTETGNAFSASVTLADIGVLFGFTATRYGASVAWSDSFTGAGDYTATTAEFMISSSFAALDAGSRGVTATINTTPDAGGLAIAGWV